MIKKHIEQAKKWYEARSKREKFAILIAAFAVIYFFFNLLFLRPVNMMHKQLNSQIVQAQAELDRVKQQTSTILSVVTASTFQKELIERKKIASQTQSIKQRLATISPNIVTADTFSKMIKDILAAQGDVNLISMKKLPVEPWLPKELVSPDLPAYFTDTYKYSLEINFHSNYFGTLAYLQRLEKLTGKIYWDTLQYKVVNYPEADVTVVLHILVNEKNLP